MLQASRHDALRALFARLSAWSVLRGSWVLFQSIPIELASPIASGLPPTIGGKVLDIVDDVVEDKDEVNKLKFQIQRQRIETKGSELEAQAKIVLAEAQGSWLQRNWRPLLMVVFAGLMVAHWFGFTASNIPESVRNSLLNIVMVSVGGYVMGRSAEKVVSKWQQK